MGKFLWVNYAAITNLYPAYFVGLSAVRAKTRLVKLLIINLLVVFG